MVTAKMVTAKMVTAKMVTAKMATAKMEATESNHHLEPKFTGVCGRTTILEKSIDYGITK